MATPIRQTPTRPIVRLAPTRTAPPEPVMQAPLVSPSAAPSKLKVAGGLVLLAGIVYMAFQVGGWYRAYADRGR